MPQFFKKNLLSDDDNPVKILLSWRAPSRPFRRKDRSYYTTVAVLIILISLIAFLAGEKLLIGVLFALGFVVYVLNFTRPEEIDYKISTQGITIGEQFYPWRVLDSFWFSQKEGHRLMNVLTSMRFPRQLIMVLDGVSEEAIEKVCAKQIVFQEVAPKNLLDHWSESLQKHFPLENPHR